MPNLVLWKQLGSSLYSRSMPKPYRFPLSEYVSGFLYLRTDEEVQRNWWWDEMVSRVLVPAGRDELTGLPLFTFKSKTPIFHESLFGEDEPFRYPVLLWDVGWCWIWLGKNKNVMESFEHVIFKTAVDRWLRRTKIDVHKILLAGLNDAAVTFGMVSLRPRSGRHAFSSINYYGEDLKQSRRFIEDSGGDDYRAQSLRLVDVRTRKRFMSVGSDGFLSFGRSELSEIGIALRIYRDLKVFRSGRAAFPRRDREFDG